MERGRIDRYTLATIRRLLRALDASATLQVLWGGRGDLDRLLDADHASLVARWAELLASAGWETWTEASYSIYGERGRIDLLAWHPATGTLAVTEAKTGLWDVQDTLGRLDVKVRLGAIVAEQRGWRASRTLGCLVLADRSTTRRRVQQHARLFATYDVRGREAWQFVRDPRRPAQGILAFVDVTPSARRPRGGRRRVRRDERTAGMPSANGAPP